MPHLFISIANLVTSFDLYIIIFNFNKFLTLEWYNIKIN